MFDELFPDRDIQFDNPQVPILCPPPFEPRREGAGIGRIFTTRQGPATPTIESGHPLESPGGSTAIGQDQHDGPGIGLAAGQNRGEAAHQPGPAHQTADFKVGRKPPCFFGKVGFHRPVRPIDSPADRTARFGCA